VTERQCCELVSLTFKESIGTYHEPACAELN